MNALLPDRHPNQDFFVCDIFDALPGFRDDMASMEHPVFSLSTKPDTRTLYYEHNGNSIKIIPSTLGLATIHDKDILIYCISYLRAAMQQGYEPKQVIRFTAHDMLISTNRMTDGRGYERLEGALNRLRGTTINTNIKTGGFQITKGFGLIDSWEIVRKHPVNGRMVAIEIKLSDWFFHALAVNELLSISRDYFRLRKPLERRLYELARKHCGEQSEWAISLEKLKLKAGSTSDNRKFRYLINQIIQTDCKMQHFPDYAPSLQGNIVIFRNKRRQDSASARNIPPLAPWAFEKATAPGLDVYSLEREWREWIEGKPAPAKGYEAAFIGFCKRHYARKSRLQGYRVIHQNQIEDS